MLPLVRGEGTPSNSRRRTRRHALLMSVLPCMLIAAILVAAFFTVGHIGVRARRHERAALAATRARMLATLATVDGGTASRVREEVTAASPSPSDHASVLALANAPRHAEGELGLREQASHQGFLQRQEQQSPPSQQQQEPRSNVAHTRASAEGAARATRGRRKRGAADEWGALDSAADGALSR